MTAAQSSAGSGRAARARPRAVALWLLIVAGLVVAMILLGGLTRLTDSGLSITEWKPVTGALPPLSEQAWEAELERYRQIPEYQNQNRGMTLSEFKAIYWWEWSHRQLGRLIGLGFAAPLAAFWIMGAIPRGLKLRLLVLLALGGLQGAVGWWMVASGLEARVDVSQHRLAVHLSLAFVLLGAIWWTALDVRAGGPSPWRATCAAAVAIGIFALVCAQIVLGAYVAGLDGGRIAVGWPLVDGRLIPDTYGALSPWLVNALDNPVAAQIHHRFVGYAVVAAAFAGAALLRRSATSGVRGLAWLVAVVAAGQGALGVVTLVHAAPIVLSALHQLGAVALFLAALALMRRAGAVTSRSSRPASPR
jgi:cytochrome c oxidase assembly protein subunit 15